MRVETEATNGRDLLRRTFPTSAGNGAANLTIN